MSALESCSHSERNKPYCDRRVVIAGVLGEFIVALLLRSASELLGSANCVVGWAMVANTKRCGSDPGFGELVC